LYTLSSKATLINRLTKSSWNVVNNNWVISVTGYSACNGTESCRLGGLPHWRFFYSVHRVNRSCRCTPTYLTKTPTLRNATFCLQFYLNLSVGKLNVVTFSAYLQFTADSIIIDKIPSLLLCSKTRKHGSIGHARKINQTDDEKFASTIR